MGLVTKSKLGVLLISCALSGCGGENVSEEKGSTTIENGTSPTVTYSAQDVLRTTDLVDTLYINLQDNMSSSDGSDAYLIGVRALSENKDCQVKSATSSGFSVSAQTASVCNYIYTVSGTKNTRATQARIRPIGTYPSSRSVVNSDGTSSATVTVLAGETTETLKPISAVTTLNTPVTIDPVIEQQAYGDIIDASYTLQNDASIPTSDTTGSSVVVDDGEQTITYTPGQGFQGVERVLYSYSDGLNVKSGSLDIAVSTTSNSAPIAESFHYLHEGRYPVPYNMKEVIDVKTHIYDRDGDTLQLIDAFAFDASITIPQDANGDGNHYNDSQFTFQSQHAGTNTITYVVTDNRGGYATGTIGLTVNNAYKNIFVQVGSQTGDGDDLLFSPPYSVKQAHYGRLDYIPGPVGDGSQSLKDTQTATHNWATADGLCLAQGGSLPTMEQLQHLYAANPSGQIFNNGDPAKANENWPIDLPYWTSETATSGIGGQYQTIDLGTGLIGDNVSASEFYYYVACLSKEAIDVEVEGPNAIAIQPSVPDGTAQYALVGVAADNSTSTINTNQVSWSMIVSDPYFVENGIVVLNPTNGSFDYFPSLNVERKTGYIDVQGCNNDGVCDTKHTKLGSVTICGEQFNDADLNNASDTCLKVADLNGNRMASSPSLAVLEILGFTLDERKPNENPPNSGNTYAEVFETTQAPFGTFATFFAGDPNIHDRQALRWCQKLSELNFAERRNWTIGTEAQMKSMIRGLGDLSEKGWPVITSNGVHWTSTRYDGTWTRGIDITQGSSYLISHLSTSMAACYSANVN
ncbi:hypothetical protein M5245_000330 [Vibrio vulnificus]|nr:hypothetical protein [Vibrio vulnificus]EHH0743571.1 hypothetical protein [Vibrio vulnificus]EJE8554843.1 hypothetical protein [Vibrio vulnificus]